MVVMSVTLDNFMAFTDFNVNFSYPKKLVKSYIKSEHIVGCPKFRYKKLIILLGANASGKTSLGQILNRILNFIVYKNAELLIGAVCDNTQEAKLSIDFVLSDEQPELYRLSLKIAPFERDELKTNAYPKIEVCVKNTAIEKNDSYEKAKERLDKHEAEYSDNYIEKLRTIPPFGYFFSYPFDVKPTTPRKVDNANYRNVLEIVLKVLDPSIVRVERVREAQNSYSIKFLGGSSVLIQEGKTVNTSLLSSGTKAGIAIADILTAIMEHENGFYYCDERFSYIQSDVECAILGLMTEHLGDNEQMFFTTQNTDILALPYPKHSYMFLRKTVEGGAVKIQAVSADKYLKRNTDVLRRAVENDLFLTAPNIDRLLELSKDEVHAE